MFIQVNQAMLKNEADKQALVRLKFKVSWLDELSTYSYSGLLSIFLHKHTHLLNWPYQPY